MDNTLPLAAGFLHSCRTECLGEESDRSYDIILTSLVVILWMAVVVKFFKNSQFSRCKSPELQGGGRTEGYQLFLLRLL